MLSQQINLPHNQTLRTQQNQIVIVSRQTMGFKLIGFVKKSMHNKIVKQLLRVMLYVLVLIILMAIVNKNPSSTIYSTVQMQQTDKEIFLRKQIPGIFPPLSTKWSLLLNKWSIQAIRGQQIIENLNQKTYQLQFKHFQDEQKPDILYITRQNNCNGHVMMNWQVHGSNIFFTEFQPPQQKSMIIPNQPQDEKCILGNGEIIQLLKYSTIWTVSQESNSVAMFLLIQRMDNNKDRSNNVVMIANQVRKV